MDRAHQQTDEELARLERRIRRLYTQAEKDLEEKLNAHMDKFRAKDAFFRRQLQDGKITAGQYKSWRAGQIFTGKRWQAKLDSMTAALAQTNELALSLINSQLPGVFANNANWLAYSLEEGAGVNFGFDLYDEATVARLIREQPRLLPDRKLDIPKDKRWSKTKISQQITQGIIQGERLDQIATRLQTVTGMERVYALTNARTAMTGAQNAGRQERMREAEGMGIKLHKVWLSTLDGHTRTEHARLDGQKKPVDEPFEIDGYKIRYPGDPSALPAMVYNCRCTTITDLDDYPDEYDAPRYDNIDGKPIKGMTYEEWAEAKQPGLYRKHFGHVSKITQQKELTGIRDALGDKFVDHMQKMLDAVDNSDFREVYYKYGDRLGVIDANRKKGAHYDPRTPVPGNGKVGGIRFNSAVDEKGDSCHRPYQTAFHEFGHNIDRLATGGSNWLSLEYKNGALGKAIEDDYNTLIDTKMGVRKKKLLARARETVNNYSDLELRQAFMDLGNAKGKDFSDLTADLRRGRITREQALNKYRKDLEENEYSAIKYLLPNRKDLARELIEDIKKENLSIYDVGSVSDILEGCTGISYPLGVGHGASYHEETGYTPLEFFAETCDGYIANPASYAQMKRFFPTAVDIVEEIMKELAK